MIDFNSKITLKLVLEVIVIVVAVVSMWFNLRGEIQGVEHKLDGIGERLNRLESSNWQATEDYVFMERFSRANQLEMPSHKGGG